MEHLEYGRLKKMFPDLAALVKTFKFDHRRPHAIICTMLSGQDLYFDCDGKNESRFTLTTDPEVISKIRGSTY